MLKITEFIVKKILHQLKCFVNPDEYRDVVECAQMLVSEILSREVKIESILSC